MIDIGRGRPILVIPGIQGRWEWMRPAIDTLAAEWRVLTFSLDVVPADASCFDRWEAHIDACLDRAGIRDAAIVGVSFGGVVAARYAARRPERVSSLVLVSAPGPGFQLAAQQESYLRRPVLSLPAFAVRAAFRLLPEVLASQPTWPGRARVLARHLTRTLRYPANPRKMAEWAKAWRAAGLAPARGQDPIVRAPTLVMTGEPSLDRVVPVASTLEYLNAIPGARHVVLRRTGHLGLVLVPETFGRLVGEFVRECDVSGAGGPDRRTAG